MPLIGAGLLPRSPLLLPGLLPEIRLRAAKTSQAINELANEMYALQPDVILLIASESAASPTASYGLLQAPKFFSSFKAFGDLVTKAEFNGAVGFTYHLKESGETKFPLPLLSPAQLPHIFGLPLIHLGKPLNSLPVACLQVPKQISLDDLDRLTGLLEETLARTSERVVMVAAGDLGHHWGSGLAESSLFDKLFQAAVAQNKLNTLLNIDSQVRERSLECLWSPTVVLYSVLSQRRLATRVLSYESPFDVGFLVAQLELG